jgi:hypothetical protein
MDGNDGPGVEAMAQRRSREADARKNIERGRALRVRGKRLPKLYEQLAVLSVSEKPHY